MGKEQTGKQEERYVKRRADIIQNFREAVLDAPWFVKWSHEDDISAFMYDTISKNLNQKDRLLCENLFFALQCYLLDRLGGDYFEDEIGNDAVFDFIRKDLRLQVITAFW